MTNIAFSKNLQFKSAHHFSRGARAHIWFTLRLRGRWECSIRWLPHYMMLIFLDFLSICIVSRRWARGGHIIESALARQRMRRGRARRKITCKREGVNEECEDILRLACKLCKETKISNLMGFPKTPEGGTNDSTHLGSTILWLQPKNIFRHWVRVLMTNEN